MISLLISTLLSSAFGFKGFPHPCQRGQNLYDPSTSSGVNAPIRKVITQGSSRFYLGDFTFFNSTPRNYIAKTSLNGTIDSNFNTNTGTAYSGAISTGIYDPGSSRLVIGSAGTLFNGATRGKLTRLQQDGTIDAFDSSPLGAITSVNSIVALGANSYLVGGVFSTDNLMKVTAAGSWTKDSAFDGNLGSGFSANVFEIAPYGGIFIVSGSFVTVNGNSRGRIYALNPDGTENASPNFGVGFNNNVYSIAINGTDIYVSGSFSTYKSSSSNVNYLSKILSDGSIAPFVQGSGFNSPVDRIWIDGPYIYAAGAFTSYNGTSVPRLVRLYLANGSLDTSFIPIVQGVNSATPTFFGALEESIGILLFGDFTSYRGQNALMFARICR